MRYVLKALKGRTYDQFFRSRSPVTPIQFWGLILLGGCLTVAGFTFLAVILSDVSLSSLDVMTIVVLLVPVGICGATIYLGVLYIRRALARKRQV